MEKEHPKETFLDKPRDTLNGNIERSPVIVSLKISYDGKLIVIKVSIGGNSVTQG